MTEVTRPQRQPRLGPSRTDVLLHLRGTEVPQSIVMVAQAVGLHPNTARFHLDALVEEKLATREIERRNQPGRPRLLYEAEPVAPDPALVYQDLASALVRQLDRITGHPADQVEEAGLQWGEELAASHLEEAPLDRVMATLGGLGYRPSLVGEPPEAIVMAPCPFQAIITPSDEGLPSVCRLHLGLIRGLVADDPSIEVTEVHAWTTPTSCVARLTRHDDA